MSLFKIENSQIQKIKSAKADREKDIQKVFEQNLETILSVYFLETEYSTSFGGRIDSLGVDKDGSPVIIEYKKTQSESIINQGLSYLKWLLDHKDSFEKLVSEKLPKALECPINWDTPRVICVAESYNKFDLDTVDILPIKIELLTYTLYEDNILQVEAQNQERVKVSTSEIIKNGKKDKEEQLQKNYTVEEHLEKCSKDVKELFLTLKEKITSIDENINEVPKKLYVAYKINGTNFADVIFYPRELRVSLNVKSGDLNDPNNITTDFTKPKKGHWGNGDYEAKILRKEDVDKVFDLIKQSYDYNK